MIKGFGIVNKAEIDVFLELSCFFDDPVDVGNLIIMGFPRGLVVKNLPASAGDARDSRDTGSIPGLGRSPGGEHGNPFQCSCLENPIYKRGGPWSIGSQRVRNN